MKTVISGLVGFIVGVFGTLSLKRDFASKLDNRQVVEFQAAEILKGNLVARGEDAQVILMIRNLIEKGICRDSSIQYLYSTEETRGMVARPIEDFYFSLGEEPPSHVKNWLLEKEITYSGVSDSFTGGRMSLSERGGVLNVVAEFRNRSNHSWVNVSSVGLLRNKVRTSEKTIFEHKNHRGEVAPGETISFSFDFQLGDKRWPEEVMAEVELSGGEQVDKN